MKIQAKITLTYVVLAILIVASLGTFTSIWMESYFKNRLVGDLSRQADLVLYTLREDTTKSFEEIDATIKFLSGLENLRISLIDQTGTVIADSDVPLTKLSEVKNHLNRPEVQQALQIGIGHDIRRSATVGRDFLYMAK